LIEFSVLPGNLSPISARLFPISFWASISTISSSSLQISFCDEKYALIRTDEKMHDLSYVLMLPMNACSGGSDELVVSVYLDSVCWSLRIKELLSP
jgi:hypothetical protein